MIDITYNIHSQQSQPHKDIKVQASIHLNTSFENDNFFEQLHLKSSVAILVHNNCKIAKLKKAINMIDILNIIFNEWSLYTIVIEVETHPKSILEITELANLFSNDYYSGNRPKTCWSRKSSLYSATWYIGNETSGQEINLQTYTKQKQS